MPLYTKIKNIRKCSNLFLLDLKFYAAKLIEERKKLTIHQVRYKFKQLISKIKRFSLNKDFIYDQCPYDAHKTFVVNLYERLGDIIASEPIARHLKQKYPNCKLKWITHPSYQALFECNPFVDQVILANNLAEVELITLQSKNNGCIIVDCLFNGRSDEPLPTTNIHVNTINPLISNQNYFLFGGLLEIFSLTAGLPPLKTKPKIWTNAQETLKTSLIKHRIGDKPVVSIHCTSSQTSKNYSLKSWQIIVKALIDKGYCVIEIGLKPNIQLSSKSFIDVTQENLSLSESINILKLSNYFIGIDSSFAHVANAINIPSIILLGRCANFAEYSPFSNINRNRVELRNPRGYASDIDPKFVLSAFQYLEIRQRLQG